MPRNQPRSSRGRSAIARRVMNTGNTNGFMYQGTCIAEDGTKITPCHNFGGMKKGGAHPSATGFMRARPWQISVPAKRKNFVFRMNTSQVTTEQAKSTAVCTLDSHCPENHHCHPDHELADKITGCMKDDDMHVDDNPVCMSDAYPYTNQPASSMSQHINHKGIYNINTTGDGVNDACADAASINYWNRCKNCKCFVKGVDENGGINTWQCGNITDYNSDSVNNICGGAGEGYPVKCTPP